jgi:hypothetical protein
VVRGLDAAAGSFAKPRLGGSDGLRMVTTEIHEQMGWTAPNGIDVPQYGSLKPAKKGAAHHEY